MGPGPSPIFSRGATSRVASRRVAMHRCTTWETDDFARAQSDRVGPATSAGPRKGKISRFRIRPVTAAGGHAVRTGIFPDPRRDVTLAL
jgi:hypothetical protein